MTGVLSGAEQAQWEEDGWCVVPGLLPPETIAAAQAVLPGLVPTAEEFADNADPARNEPFRVDSHRVMPRFPFEDGALNDIVVHDRIIDLAEQLLGVTDTDLRLYQAMLSAKYGEGALSDEQLLHVDFGNHTLVVPRHEPGYQQLEMFVYLSDVTPETAATRVVSRRLTPDIPVERTYLSQTDYADLYAAEVPASGPAGSILAYRPDVYHRGVRMTAPRSARFMVHVSYKPAATDWLGSHGLPNAAEDMSWYRFVQHANERQLTVLGFPPPGHPYWTAQTLAGVAARYPMLDLSPWRDAAAGTVRPGGVTAADEPWWKTGVLYQIYPRSFADSNADGVGDIPGIVEHLDYLAWLGVDGIWLSPVTVSPNADWGYDVSDFCAIAPEFGTMDDFDRLIAEAGARGIRVLMDIVPNHTSEEHPWFVESRSSRTSAHRDWYVWADGKEDGELPNNWVSSFGGPGWTLDEATGQYYFHNHLQEQPDLNWWNEDVRAAFDDIFRFWSDRGVAGFRIDVANVIIKDAELRDNPPATEEDDFETQMFGQRSVYNANRPEVHEVIRRWRLLADGYEEPRLLIGETPVPVDKLAEFYGNGSDELGLAFNFNFISAPFRAPEMRAIVEETEAALPPGAWPAWTGSNHDMFRFPTRWAEDDPARVRLALLMLLSLRGTPVLYEGDEIGMANVAWPRRTCATRSACASTRTTRGATPAARPCSGAIARGAVSPTPTGPGCRWATWPPPTWRPSGTTPALSSPSAATSSPSGAAIPRSAPGTPRRC